VSNELTTQGESKDGQTNALVARQQHEIQSAILTAKHFPRDENASFVKLTKSCSRPSFADAASYSFPRGGEQITGPSVNLAREAARCWGNIRYGVDQLPAEEGHIHLEAWAMDLEACNKVTAQDRFRKLIERKKRGGGTEWREPNERDLRELINRRGALQLRNCILQLLPVDLVEDALFTCDKTLEAASTGQLKEDRSATVRRLLKAFDQVAVTQQMIERHLGHAVADISPEEQAELRRIYTSMRDNNSTREDHFPTVKDEEPAKPEAVTGPVNDLSDLTSRISGATDRGSPVAPGVSQEAAH
jgi:hypothetical protein